ncbi:MAG: hypothetical protein JO362_01645 [Streptomycetaceae bacterium]|nr:hypothetical protein [Streptomycetaceae bacterium]
MNIGTGIATDGHTLVTTTSQTLGRPLTVEYDPARLRPSDRHRLVANPRRLTSLLPWWPATTVEEGLAVVLRAEAPTGDR